MFRWKFVKFQFLKKKNNVFPIELKEIFSYNKNFLIPDCLNRSIDLFRRRETRIQQRFFQVERNSLGRKLEKETRAPLLRGASTFFLNRVEPIYRTMLRKRVSSVSKRSVGFINLAFLSSSNDVLTIRRWEKKLK